MILLPYLDHCGHAAFVPFVALPIPTLPSPQVTLPFLPLLPYPDYLYSSIFLYLSPKNIRCYDDHANALDFALIQQLRTRLLGTCCPNTGAACRCLVL